ncbi:FAD/FMN-containing dehydrogenase [Actinoplanes lutulentus]|uniref:FAD/FMN-containing dehydrogenase n=1 Tax=Actinoplanes lutulentus TaxID=1287878 RepID=A0A327ZG39_9ACTN|nr:FAD-binding oxidoreductase [Actinoplanes lutulentus]MBB2947219.1 FAD/FMN-containing dehydrogenase [Actinoplanes lutulentus]RAK36494.1 FAD/FMN-containing dehydrogenase [Actinoplanes lutulentus]
MTDFAQLRSVTSAEVILPGENGYDRHRRVWNADIDRRPAAIVRCRDAKEVSAALTWCVQRDIDVTVRGGGHNLAGTAVADGAVLLDTAPMNDVVFDLEAGTVTVGGGCRWGDVDRPAAEHGVAVPAGVVSHTGVAGLTLGGGAGYLARLHGATVDFLVAAEIVVADGRILQVSDTEHADLFWALRGAGHNYGVVTSFTFRYVPLPGLATIRQALYAADDRREVLRFFRDWAPTAPDNVTTYARLLTCPPYWSQVEAEHRGKPVLSIATVHYGDPAAEPALTAPMFAQARPVYESLRTIPHVTLQHSTDDEFRYGIGHYWKHIFLESFADEVIDTAIDWSDKYPGRPLQAHSNIAHQVLCPFEVIGGGGAMTRRDTTATAMSSHGLAWGANIGADWEFAEEKPELVAWAKSFADAMGPFQGGTYINFASVQGDEDVARAVYGANYDRLVAVKRSYDPANIFRRGLVDLSGGTAK